MVDPDFVPETLEWCREHYIPPINKYISCDDFGYSDGMNGSCHWCLEMCPYQWEMCQDEDLLRRLLPNHSREDAIKLIERYKQSRFATV